MKVRERESGSERKKKREETEWIQRKEDHHQKLQFVLKLN